MAGRVTIDKTDDIDVIKTILFHKDLINVALPPEDLAGIEAGTAAPSSNYTYLLIYHDDEVAGLFRYEAISNITISWHIHLLPKYWGKAIGDKADTAACKWILDNTKYRKIVGQSPYECREVHRAMVRNGYEVEGVLTNAIFWNDKIQHLILMSKTLQES